MTLEQYHVADLESADHFRFCSAIKALTSIESLSERSIVRVAKCASSPILAVEGSALVALASLGSRAECVTTALVERLALRLRDAGCDYSCCGYGAFHGPIAHYIDALRAMTSITNERAFRERIDSVPVAERDKDFIAFLVGDA